MKKLMAVVLTLMVMAGFSGIVFAGNLDSPAAPTDPGSAMFTLEDIYNRLNTGAAGTKRPGPFVEPSSGPTTGTGHTLDEVIGLAPSVDDTNGAGVADVLADKTFWGLKSGEWGVKTGTVTAGSNVNGADGSKTFTIPDGLYSGSKEATANDANLTAANIKKDVDIFGVVGSVIASTGTAGAADVLTGKTFSNATASGVAGSMTNNGAGTTITPGTTDHTIAAGYWSSANTVKGDADLTEGNIKSGVDIFGVQGNRHCGCDCSLGTLNGTRWCDNGDGTVTDLTTCLVWLKNALWGGSHAFWVNTINGTNAHDRAAQLRNGVGDLTDGSVEGDWRLPTKTELYNLAHGTEEVRSGNMRAFTGVQSDYYWSSTTYASNPVYAWTVYMTNGAVHTGNKDDDYYVWPVRSGN